jgi:glycosyltransferase involved in cell wall biosynthesis/HEAT repeat protein
LGKTTELETAYENAKGNGHMTSLVRLRNVPTIDDLRRELREGQAAWADQDAAWYIFIDGLDETPASGPEIQSWLLSVFRDIAARAGDGRELPRLRLTCRSADWPDRFEEDLATIWGEDRTGVLQLTPLTEQDVRLAAASWPSDQQEHFITSLTTQGLWSLATSPVTLNMLKQVFATFGGKLPSGLVDTYRRALLALVEDRRRSATPRPAPEYLTPIELLRLLGRIATVSILSGKPIIWSGLYADPVPPDAVPVTDLAGGIELGLPQPLNADERALRQALRSAAFLSDGPNRLAWLHQSFVEFLAADYLAQTVFDSTRLRELLFVEEDGNYRVRPQLREVAAWLAGMNDRFRNQLIQSDPDLLLRSDVASADVSFKFDLVSEVLARLENGELLDAWNDPRVDYARLEYPGIYDVLGPHIRNPKGSIVARRAAITMARDCVVFDAKLDLLAVAIDLSDAISIRAAAVIALGAIGDEETLRQLKPLIHTELATDPQDEIRGAALRVLWPKYLSDSELFDSLNAPRDNHLLGWYKSFIYQLKFQQITRNGSVIALQWLQQLPADQDHLITFRTLIVNVLVAAWANADDPSVLGAFADVLCMATRDYNTAIASTDLSDFQSVYDQSSQTLRRGLAVQIAMRAQNQEHAVRTIMHGPLRLITVSDLQWILPDLDTGSSPIPEAVLIDMIVRVIHVRDIEEISFLWDYANRNAALAETLQRLFTTDLQSVTAEWAKRDHERKQEAARQPPRTPARHAQLDELLKLCEQDPGTWWRVNFVLLMSDTPAGNELTGDLTASPGWAEADSKERHEIVRTAFRYLTEYSLEDFGWIGSNTILRPAAAGYRALRLLYSENRDQFDKVPVGAWSNWVGAIIWFPNNDDREERGIRREIAIAARDRVPDRFKQTLDLTLSRADSILDIAEVIDSCFDSDVGGILWKAILEYKLNIYSRERLLEILIKRGYQPALDWIIETLAAERSDTVETAVPDPLTIYGPAVWFVSSPEEAWPLVWQRRLTNPDHAHAIWLRIAENRLTELAFLSKLTPDQLGQLYRWLGEKYPEEQHRLASGFLSAEDQLRMMRANVIERLGRIATDEAISVISRLRVELPNDPWIPWQLKAAREARRLANWRRAEPREILRQLGIDVAVYGSRAQSIVAAAMEPSAERVGKTDETILQLPNALDAPETGHAPPPSILRPTLNFLLVATEWRSAHGGVSTFNRDLAIALRQRGHIVTCLFPEISISDQNLALAAGVQLASVAQPVGYGKEELLDVCIGVPLDGSQPDYIIGHDHITGRAALRIRNEFLRSSKYIHILHTLPSESDRYKGGRSTTESIRHGDEKRERQKELCRHADGIIAIGPKVADYAHDLVSDCRERIVSLIPGLNPTYLSQTISKPDEHGINVLWIGRLDDPELKGIDIALQIAASLQSQRFPLGRRLKLVIRGANLDNNQIDSLMPDNLDKKSVDWRSFSANEGDILDDLRSASCLIMPSQTEAFGLVAHEAIAMGVPVIVSSYSGIGMFLLQHQSQSFSGIAMANGTVLDVYDDPMKTASEWAPELERRLQDRTTSFAQANALRDALAPIASWKVALDALEGHCEKIALLSAAKPAD